MKTSDRNESGSEKSRPNGIGSRSWEDEEISRWKKFSGEKKFTGKNYKNYSKQISQQKLHSKKNCIANKFCSKKIQITKIQSKKILQQKKLTVKILQMEKFHFRLLLIVYFITSKKPQYFISMDSVAGSVVVYTLGTH